MTMALFFFGVLLTFLSVFLMLLILVQRGKGGGLTGALGGMGGQSAFGARAGDAFTKITTITSIIWITVCMLTIALFNPPPMKVTTKPTPEIGMAPGDSESAADGTAEIDETQENGDGAADQTGTEQPAGETTGTDEGQSTEGAGQSGENDSSTTEDPGDESAAGDDEGADDTDGGGSDNSAAGG